MNKDLNDWIIEKIDGGIINIEEVVSTEYSYVARINTDNELYYFKQVSEQVFKDTIVLDKIKSEYIPEVISRNEDLNCFIIKSSGDVTLRDYFDGILNNRIMVQSIEKYKEIQKSTIPDIDYFINNGISDWRMENFPNAYNNLVKSEMLKHFEISEVMINKLSNYKIHVEKICNKLKKYNIPNTLNHSDFHDNNIVINKKTKNISIIDWDELNITIPILSTLSCFSNLSRRYKVNSNADNYNMIYSSCCDGWNIKKSDFQEVLNLLNLISPIYYLLTLKNLMEKSSYYFPNYNKGIESLLNAFIEGVELSRNPL